MYSTSQARLTYANFPAKREDPSSRCAVPKLYSLNRFLSKDILPLYEGKSVIVKKDRLEFVREVITECDLGIVVCEKELTPKSNLRKELNYALLPRREDLEFFSFYGRCSLPHGPQDIIPGCVGLVACHQMPLHTPSGNLPEGTLKINFSQASVNIRQAQVRLNELKAKFRIVDRKKIDPQSEIQINLTVRRPEISHPQKRLAFRLTSEKYLPNWHSPVLENILREGLNNGVKSFHFPFRNVLKSKANGQLYRPPDRHLVTLRAAATSLGLSERVLLANPEGLYGNDMRNSFCLSQQHRGYLFSLPN